MTSVTDILLQETAKSLGITPDELRSRLTQEQLADLTSSTLCSPDDVVGLPIPSLDVPCSPTSLGLFPHIEATELDIESISSINRDIASKSLKCVDDTKKMNEDINLMITQYNDRQILLDKLIEYRDNYAPVSIYFDEFSKEFNRVTSIFQPLLVSLAGLEDQMASLQAISQSTTDPIKRAEVAVKLAELNESINDLNVQIQSERKDNLSILGASRFGALTNYLGNVTSVDQSYPLIDSYLKNLFDDIIGPQQFSTIREQISQYSQNIVIGPADTVGDTVRAILAKSYFSFSLRFPQLDSIRMQREKYDVSTGTRAIEDYSFKIKDNELLQKSSFFDDTDLISVSELILAEGNVPHGIIYDNYYNLFSDPINNFFSIEERGLTSNVAMLDPKVKGTSAEKKKEKDREFYVSDLEKMQLFYEEFGTAFEKRKDQRRQEVIDPAKEGLRITLREVVRQEVQLLVSLGQIDRFLPADSYITGSVTEMITSRNTTSAQAVVELNGEIDRLTAEIEELKPTPDKIKLMLKERSPDCFKDIDSDQQDCEDIKSSLGSDPFSMTTIQGSDPTLPTYSKFCYWKEFAKSATKQGLIPVPNKGSSALRYWPIGLVVPSPNGIVKVPLPIVWLPLVVMPSSFGTLVFFLTITGVFVSPVVFLASNSGLKQHMLTVRGSSERFGYSAQDDSVKSSVASTIRKLADSARSIRDSITDRLGEYHWLTTDQFAKMKSQLTILDSMDVSDPIKARKIDKERATILEANSGLSPEERAASLLDREESASDAVEQAKIGTINRVYDLGPPQTSAIDDLKDRSISRNSSLLSSLHNALSSGDILGAKKLRQELTSDGLTILDKKRAIESDVLAHFDKIVFPKMTIPRDNALLDPVLNQIYEFNDIVKDFSSTHKTQFFSNDTVSVRTLFSKHFAKERKSLTSLLPNVDADGLIDVSSKAITDSFVSMNHFLADSILGTKSTNSVSDELLSSLSYKYENEPDPIKKKSAKIELEKAQSDRAGSLDVERTRDAFGLTTNEVARLSQNKVKYDISSKCCKEPVFSLSGSDPISETTIKSTRASLDSKMLSLSGSELARLSGGAMKVSRNDLLSIYLAITRTEIPTSLTISAPALDIATFSSSFSGLIGSMFEEKASNPAANSPIGKTATIDLNLAKQTMRDKLALHLEKVLPSTGQSDLEVVSCDPSLDGPGNVSSLSHFTQFNNIEKDFLSIGSSDISSIIKSFIDITFTEIETQVEPFYRVLSGVKSMKGVGLNLIEDSQFSALPFGPIAKDFFLRSSELIRDSKRSTNFKIFDDSAISGAIPKLEALSKIQNVPITIASTCSLDSFSSRIKKIEVDGSGSIRTMDDRPSSAIRDLHPILNQDDLPPWERLSSSNPLFALFLDEFVSVGADQIGFFRS